MNLAWLPAACWWSACAFPLAWTDIKTRRLPNRPTLAAYTGTIVLLVAAASIASEWPRLLSAGLGGLALATFYLLLAVTLPRGLGLGDVKLAASTGTLLGWHGLTAIVMATMAAFVLAAVYGVVILMLRRAAPSAGIPFAPFIVAGAIGPALLQI